MKTLKISLLLILFSTLSVAGLYAQAEMEDVIYLKNGSIYRGVIVEQVPNVSMKIKTLGGNVFAVTMAEIEKITKEEKPAAPRGEDYRYGMHHGFGGSYHGRDSTYHKFKYPNSGRFALLQILVENKQGGVRLVQGYKFNRHAALGIGIGADFVFSSPFNQRINNLPSNALAGVYVPLYLHLTGDMFPARITPFYAVEAGYFMAGLQRGRDRHDVSFRRPDAHGPMASAGLGVKFNSKRGLNFSILFNMNMKNVNYKENVTYYDVFGNSYVRNERKNATLVFPGIRFGLGFTSAGHKYRHMHSKAE
ncbi:MAG: hypothetical protein V4615_00730 [Bacteroidota bacterium]